MSTPSSNASSPATSSAPSSRASSTSAGRGKQKKKNKNKWWLRANSSQRLSRQQHEHHQQQQQQQQLPHHHAILSPRSLFRVFHPQQQQQQQQQLPPLSLGNNSSTTITQSNDGSLVSTDWKLVHSLTDHADTVLCVLVDEARSLLFCGLQTGVIKCWYLPFYEAVAELKGHRRPVVAMLQPPSNRKKYVISCSMDCTVRLWAMDDDSATSSTTNGCPIRLVSVLRGFTGSPVSACFADNESTLWVGGRDTNIVGVKELFSQMQTTTDSTCQVSHRLAGHTAFVYALVYNHTTHCLFSASGDHTIRMWRNPSGGSDGDADDVLVLTEHTDRVVALHLVDDRLLVSGSDDASVRIWDVSNPELAQCTRQFHCMGPVLSVFCTGPLLASSSVGGWVEWWDMKTYRQLASSPSDALDEVATVNAGVVVVDGNNTTGDDGSGGAAVAAADVMCFGAMRHLVFTGANNGRVLVWSSGRTQNRSYNNNNNSSSSSNKSSESPHHGSGVKLGRQRSMIETATSSTTVTRLDYEVMALLKAANAQQYVRVFEQHEIDRDSVLLLTERDLETMNIPLGPRRKLATLLKNIESVPSFTESDVAQSLREFVALQTISIGATPFHRQEGFKAAKWLQGLLDFCSFETQMVLTGKNPLVVARRRGAKDAPAGKRVKVLFYGHYDVVGIAKRHEWDSDPFRLTGRNGFLYGRGASDNKGPILAMIFALKELYEVDDDFDAVLVFEGEEEAGTMEGGFVDAVEGCRAWLTASGPVDLIVSSNSYWLDDVTPCIVYGMRGVTKLKVEVDGPRDNLHSGVHGGVFHEPLTELCRVLATLVDSDGRILVSHIYDDVAPPEKWLATAPDHHHHHTHNHNHTHTTTTTNDDDDDDDNDDDTATTAAAVVDMAEYRALIGEHSLRANMTPLQVLQRRWCSPSLSIHNVIADNAASSSIVAKRAQAYLSIRTVPYQKTRTVVQQFTTYIHEQFAALQSTCRLSVTELSSGDWWLGDPGTTYFTTAANAVETIWGMKPRFIREGGTIPAISALERMFTAQAIQIPLGQNSDQAHLPNERLRLRNLVFGKRVIKEFINQLRNKAAEVGGSS